ncbi:CD209 antigen-like protein C [Megalobrama amblycephala]|uniref:CD209 antigen-like protein C n=1 Tax=Megalobrama amblycephala TaxID=75352 RepID=UPI002013F8AC|nr:CD209 antigen-like protein C [Megalobrama amblycephala]
MSESIYANVNADGIYEMDEEDREEMTCDANADTIKSHDVRRRTKNQTPQHTGSDCVKISSRAAAVCLMLLFVLLLTAVIVLCVQLFTNIDLFQFKSKNIMEERELLTKITNLTEERDKLLSKNKNLTNERDGLLSKNDNLTKQRDQLNQERNELVKTLNETDGWLYYKFSFYFISYEKKSWAESRKYCTERGADLIIINNREEQEFANQISSRKEFWIGLNEENTWKWVDGTNMSFRFWGPQEPNGVTAKNCAVSHSSGWHDYQCNYEYIWICEKSFAKYLV